MRIKPYKCMSAHVYQFKCEHSKKEMITQRRKLALFNALMYSTCTCTIIATALQNSLCIHNKELPQHVKNGPYGIQKFNTP